MRLNVGVFVGISVTIVGACVLIGLVVAISVGIFVDVLGCNITDGVAVVVNLTHVNIITIKRIKGNINIDILWVCKNSLLSLK
jgi:uncharacterized membrane protein